MSRYLNNEKVSFQIIKRDTIRTNRPGYDISNHDAGDWGCCFEIFFETLEVSLQGDSTNQVNFTIRPPSSLSVEVDILGKKNSSAFGLSICQISENNKIDTLIVANKQFINVYNSSFSSDTLNAFYYNEVGQGLVGFILEGEEWALE
ncbi:MAG: hypothetical protein ACI9XO_000253 [Paraglaciecola sp.]|jgi:hypothetical protein